MRVALFITCFNDTLFPDTGRATVTLLERLGCTVEFPPEQTCCGQMHGNSGYEDAARPLLERFARVFAGAEAVVSPSASCVGFVRERLGDGPPVYELTEFLVDVLGTRAEVCTAVDMSCLMHIGGALERQRAGVRVMHMAEILAARE